MNAKINISSILMFFLGLTLPIGEQMNQYLPYSSKWFVIVAFMVILYAGILIVKEGKSQLSKLQMQLLFVLILIFFINVIRIITGAESVSMYLLQEVLFALIALSITLIAPENKNTCKAFSIGYIMTFFVLTFFSSYNTYYGNEVRFVGTYLNPNRYALDIMLAMYILMSFIVDNKNKKNNRKILSTAILMLLFLFCAYLLLETGTRSVVLAVSICALLYIYYYCSAKQKIILSIIIPIIAIIILIIYADEMIFQRFMGGNYESSGYSDNIRWGIWQNYLSNTDKYWLTGITEQHMHTISKKTPHNTYLGVFVRYGVLCFAVTISFIFNLIKRAIKNIKRTALKGEKMMIYAMLSIFVVCMFMEMQHIRIFWVIIAMGIVVIENETVSKNNTINIDC